MSWEGYEQQLCANGHAFDGDRDTSSMYDTEEPERSKCHCGAKIVWWNMVNLTNGSFNHDSDGNETTERIDGYVELEEMSPSKLCQCSGCGNQHFSKEATYKLPSKEIGHHIG